MGRTAQDPSEPTPPATEPTRESPCRGAEGPYRAWSQWLPPPLSASVGRLYLTATGELVLRSDVTAAQAFSKVLLPLGTWSTVELCGTVGTAGTLQVNRPSVLGSWTADLGTTAIGTIQVGDDSATTATVSVDDVRVTTP